MYLTLVSVGRSFSQDKHGHAICLELEDLLMGDFESERIDIYILGSGTKPFEIDTWAEKVAWLLLPCKIEVFEAQDTARKHVVFEYSLQAATACSPDQSVMTCTRRRIQTITNGISNVRH